MTGTYRFRSFTVCIVSIAGLIALEAYLVHSPVFTRRLMLLSGAVLFDLTVLPTLLVYWLIARPQGWPISRTLLVALLMLRVALFILPETSSLSGRLSWPLLLALTEGAVLLMAVVRLRTIVRSYRQLRPATDSVTALHGSLTPIFGERASQLLLSEAQLMYYALLGWRLTSDAPAGSRVITTHRESGQVALLIGLGMAGLIELGGAHLLLARWNPVVAWWVTALSGYSLLFLAAEVVATLKRPSYLLPQTLHLRLGVRWRVTLNRTNIATIQPIHEKPAKAADLLNGSMLTAPNLLLTLHEPVQIDGPYGLTKTVTRIALFVDRRTELVQILPA